MTDPVFSILTAVGLLCLVIVASAGVVAYALGRAAASLDDVSAALRLSARDAAHRR